MLPRLDPAHSLEEVDETVFSGRRGPISLCILPGWGDVFDLPLVSAEPLDRSSPRRWPRGGYLWACIGQGPGESFRETELLEKVLTMTSTAVSSASCALLAVPGHCVSVVGGCDCRRRGPIRTGLLFIAASSGPGRRPWLRSGRQWPSRTSMTAGSVA